MGSSNCGGGPHAALKVHLQGGASTGPKKSESHYIKLEAAIV